MRVRANAGKSLLITVRWKRSEGAKEQVETLKQLSEEDTAELTRRQRAARACREERQKGSAKRCVSARTQQYVKPPSVATAAASTTDPEPRVMKFADGADTAAGERSACD